MCSSPSLVYVVSCLFAPFATTRWLRWFGWPLELLAAKRSHLVVSCCNFYLYIHQTAMHDNSNKKLADEVSKLLKTPNALQIHVGSLDAPAMGQLLSECLDRPIKQVFIPSPPLHLSPSFFPSLFFLYLLCFFISAIYKAPRSAEGNGTKDWRERVVLHVVSRRDFPILR